MEEGSDCKGRKLERRPGNEAKKYLARLFDQGSTLVVHDC